MATKKNTNQPCLLAKSWLVPVIFLSSFLHQSSVLNLSTNFCSNVVIRNFFSSQVNLYQHFHCIDYVLPFLMFLLDILTVVMCQDAVFEQRISATTVTSLTCWVMMMIPCQLLIDFALQFHPQDVHWHLFKIPFKTRCLICFLFEVCVQKDFFVLNNNLYVPS